MPLAFCIEPPFAAKRWHQNHPVMPLAYVRYQKATQGDYADLQANRPFRFTLFGIARFTASALNGDPEADAPHKLTVDS